MILPKKLAVPAGKRYTLRITPEFLKTSPLVKKYYALQCREEDKKFVVAESSALIRTMYPGTVKIFTVGEKDYCYTSANRLYLSPSTSYLADFVGTLQTVLSYVRADGEERILFITDSAVYRMNGDKASALTGAFGGTCAVYSNERVFLGDGVRIHYSSAADADVLERTDDAGSLSLPGETGKILGLCPLKRRLYAVCEHGVYRIRAEANDLNFKIEPLLHVAGKVLAGSVQAAGRVIVFCSERGMYTFDGETERLVFPADPDLTFPAAFESCASRGRYYALVNVPSYGGAILVFDPATGERYFVCTKAVHLSGSDDHVAFLLGSRFMKLDGRGLPLYGTYECRLDMFLELFPKGGGRALIDSATVEADEGSFTLEVTTEEEEGIYFLPIGKRRYLPRTVRGNAVRLVLCSGLKNSAFRALVLHMRGEEV